MPSAALAHHTHALVLLWPPLQWQKYTHRGRKNTNQTSPIPLLSPSVDFLSFFPSSYKHIACCISSLHSTKQVLFLSQLLIQPCFLLIVSPLSCISFPTSPFITALSHALHHVPCCWSWQEMEGRSFLFCPAFVSKPWLLTSIGLDWTGKINPSGVLHITDTAPAAPHLKQDWVFEAVMWWVFKAVEKVQR